MLFRLLVVGLLVGVSATVVAYQADQFVPPAPYEIMVIDTNPQTERTLLGSLEGFPDMYEVQSAEAFTLTLQLAAVPTESVPQFSGLIIRVLDEGIEEVGRFRSVDTEWELQGNPATGLTEAVGPRYEAELPAGTYRIEVSTPSNQGKYLLTLGTEDSAGYFTSVRSVAATYDFYDRSALAMFRSPYIHYPVGIVVLLGLIGATWYIRRKQYA